MRESSRAGLRAFLEDAHQNEAESLREYSDLVAFVDRADEVFRQLLAVELRGEPLAGMLFVNAHASFMAAARLAFSAQVPPTFMTLRGAIESALYALIASESRANRDVWMHRQRDPDATRTLYTARQGIKRIKGDPNLKAMVEEAYELTIEYGGHPNFKSVVEHITFEDAGDHHRVSLTYLHSIPSTQALRAIAACAEVGVTILFITPHVFPHHEAAATAHAAAIALRQDYDRFIEAEGYRDRLQAEELANKTD